MEDRKEATAPVLHTSGSEPKRWLIEWMLPSGSVRWQVVEHEHDARTFQSGQPENPKVTALYDHHAPLLGSNTGADWHDISTAPKGERGIAWMLLAYGPHDDQSVGVGMRFQDQFFAASTFYVGGPAGGRQYSFREHEVFPTHWMPLPGLPGKEPK